LHEEGLFHLYTFDSVISTCRISYVASSLRTCRNARDFALPHELDHIIRRIALIRGAENQYWALTKLLPNDFTKELNYSPR
jgi:hypothetical protein